MSFARRVDSASIVFGLEFPASNLQCLLRTETQLLMDQVWAPGFSRTCLRGFLDSTDLQDEESDAKLLVGVLNQISRKSARNPSTWCWRALAVCSWRT